jgi:hypothetical protein
MMLTTMVDFAYSQTNPLLGTWESSHPQLWPRMVISKARISLGSADCANLPYKILEQDGNAFSVEVIAPHEKCRAYGAEGIFLRMALDPQELTMDFRNCPSRAELEKTKVSAAQAPCSWTTFGKRTPSDR